jgi:hypothetical protein
LLTQAEEMLGSFEKLCAFMSETYSDKKITSLSPINEEETSDDVIPANLEIFSPLSSERAAHDELFMRNGRVHLDAFHKSQMVYYETFSRWESNNLTKLANVFMVCYLELESKRFAIINHPDPSQIELYEGLGRQQDTLKKKIMDLAGEEGIKILERNLIERLKELEVNKWSTVPSETLTHEIALNPDLEFSLEDCSIQPQKNIETALEALFSASPNIDPIVDALEEIAHKIALFTPHNTKKVEELHHEFSGQEIKDRIAAIGLQEGLHSKIHSLIERIKTLESPEHLPETISFLDSMTIKIREQGGNSLLLKEAIDYIYQKLSQINHEVSNYKIRQERGIISRNIVSFEQSKFQERLSGNQFNLAIVLNWIDKIVKSPENHRCDISVLCSQHVGSYLAHAILIGVLQQSAPSILTMVPETFCLDRVRLINWHAKYQQILYTFVALGYMETLSAKYGIRLSLEVLFHQKNRLISAQELSLINTPKEKADDLIFALKELLKSEKTQLEASDERALEHAVVEICRGNHQVGVIMHKRLGDQLSCYLRKGHLPEALNTRIKWYGLERELGQLGKEIFPVLNLHTKVYGHFYQQQVEMRLWKPLFVTLRETPIPTELPRLLSVEKRTIEFAHAYLHKLVFLVSGLALIQQMVTYADMWNLNVAMKNSTMKDLASSFGLINMVKDDSVSKDRIEKRLMDLMKHVAEEQKINFEHEEELEMARRFRFAKTEQSPGYKAFLDELLSLFRQTIVQSKKTTLNPTNLMAEFDVDLKTIEEDIQKIILNIKKNYRLNDVDPLEQVLPLTLKTGRTI